MVNPTHVIEMILKYWEVYCCDLSLQMCLLNSAQGSTALVYFFVSLPHLCCVHRPENSFLL